MKCLSNAAKGQTWSVIGKQTANDDWLKTNGQDYTESVNKTTCEHNNRCSMPNESDSHSENGVKSASDEVQRHRMDKMLLN